MRIGHTTSSDQPTRKQISDTLSRAGKDNTKASRERVRRGEVISTKRRTRDSSN